MPVIEVIDLKKSYQETQAVDDVSFVVEPGEILGLLGPNGAGKTTTIEIIEGMRMLDSGTVRVLDIDVTRHPDEVKRHIGVQLQTTELYTRLTVREILDLFRSFFPGPTRSTAELIVLVDLGEKRNTLSKHLSGGQRQRLAVALALVNYPEIVFLDEPTTGLDPQARRAMWDTIRGIQASGVTVLLTTHYMEEAQILCDRVAVMDRGKVIALDSPDALIQQNFQETVIEFGLTGSVSPDGMFEAIHGVSRPVAIQERHVTLYSDDATATLVDLMERVRRGDLHFDALNVRTASLEDVFLKLTGKTIRE
ncbi:MAG TPA: ABC transporter ATP-binding protein [Anaerolineaceae bacterium]